MLEIVKFVSMGKQYEKGEDKKGINVKKAN
jgi:hypothetical protein